ncbi:hypothetical protein CYMTET_56993 [Cymbomonas tetramitiformis]|uniref:Uncharacterized protein n=1 Tax=Cymbomonas tetramitiformis TaxID=36881 RepID=A0AAE0BB31_9CHLO|nr:hypothetical protein CYMTET_56993 [Cymbomonas tetramitiformis]
MHPAYVAHTKDRIEKALTNRVPYEHVAIFDIFHPEYYPCLLRHLPLMGANYGGTISKGLRHYVRLLDGNGNAIDRGFARGQARHLPIPSSNFTKFWSDFARAFGSTEIRDAWLNLFNATMNNRFYGKKAGFRKSTFSRLDLSRDGKNYEIKPHTDSVVKVVTMLYYLPTDASHTELGTVVFKSKNGEKDDGGGMTWKGNGDYLNEFDIMRKGTFFPNTVFAFAPCTASWHGVPLVTEDLRRDTVQGFISLPEVKKGGKKGQKRRKQDQVSALKGQCIGS